MPVASAIRPSRNNNRSRRRSLVSRRQNVVNGLAEIAGLGQLVGRQGGSQTAAAADAESLRRADDVFFGVLIEVSLVEGRGIEGVEQLRRPAEVDLNLCFCHRCIGRASATHGTRFVGQGRRYPRGGRQILLFCASFGEIDSSNDTGAAFSE